MYRLPRHFIYRNRIHLDEFLKDNPLNEDLYDVYLDIMSLDEKHLNREYYVQLYVNRDIASIFNDVYYICTRVILTPHPELEIEHYLYEEDLKTGDRHLTHLVFSMVYAVLILQPEVPKKIHRFLKCLEKRVLDAYNYSYKFDELIEDWTHAEASPSNPWMDEDDLEPRTFKSDFTPTPEPPAIFELGIRPVIWASETYEYNPDRIKMIVNLWSDKADKLKILDVIEEAFDIDGDFPSTIRKVNKDFFMELRDEIENCSLDWNCLVEVGEPTEKRTALIRENYFAERKRLNDEIKQLKDEIALLQEKNKKLEKKCEEEAKQREYWESDFRSEICKSRHDAVREFVEKLIMYAEGEDKKVAREIKIALTTKMANGYIASDILCSEWKQRLDALGKESHMPIHIATLKTDNFYDIHNNDKVDFTNGGKG